MKSPKSLKILFMVLLVVLTGLLSSCVSINSANHQVKSITAKEEQKYDTYTVRKGDTLQKIALKFAVTKEDLYKCNNLRQSYTLAIGQKLKIPTPAMVAAAAEISTIKKHSLFWPAEGKIIRVFAKSSKGSKGIDIAGSLGQEIKASAEGKVVYSGSSLSGYGNMIIIKHNDRVVTVYALNRHVTVKEGQQVKVGEKIAEMGANEAGDVVLHFEVRIDGKPQDPLLYLVSR